MKKIAVVTGSRADYGLLRWVMEGIKKSDGMDLQTIVTGMHLSPEFGLTYKYIEQDGFSITRKLEMLLSSDTPTGITKSIGLSVCGFADTFAELKPDMLLILGDRYEILSAVTAAMIFGIPVIHVHGGELTEGAYDDSIRHAITKMSHLHFVSTDEYRLRVIQMGEQPDRVYNVGALGIDNILGLPLLSRNELEKQINFSLGKRNLLVSFHPATLEQGMAYTQIQELLSALGELKDTHILFTQPNADNEGRQIMDLIRHFVYENQNTSQVFTTLGQIRYLSAIKWVDGVIGNSSSGIIEAPSLGTGTINIGDRQKGRVRASSVIDCLPEKKAIMDAVKQLYSDKFQSGLQAIENPYGTGGGSEKIVRILLEMDTSDILKKHFFDLHK